jgi:formylglycine-generating enzyme required for sulfatase activity
VKPLAWIVACLTSLPAACVVCGGGEGRTVAVVIDIAAGSDGELWLEPVAGGSVRVRVAHRGGRYEVLPGAWRVRGANGRMWAVPAFGAPVGPDVVYLRLEPHHDGSDPDFVEIPAGPALIGDRLGVGQPDERPARVVDVAAFEIGRTEVTNREFVEFLNAVHRASPSDPTVLDLIDVQNAKSRIRRSEDGTFTTDADELPVVLVSWAGARAYCAWRTDATERVHRLPTEVEWEKAARGPDSAVYSYGNVYTPDAANQESARLMEVGRFEANGYGIHDMTGNAFEWTSDVERDEEGRVERVFLRGGSFVLDGIFLRNAFRMWLRPTVRADDVGFRVVREAMVGDAEEERR